jgi:hypothetical protein
MHDELIVGRPTDASLRATIELRRQLREVSQLQIGFVQLQRTASNDHYNNDYDDSC